MLIANPLRTPTSQYESVTYVDIVTISESVTAASKIYLEYVHYQTIVSLMKMFTTLGNPPIPPPLRGSIIYSYLTNTAAGVLVASIKGKVYVEIGKTIRRTKTNVSSYILIACSPYTRESPRAKALRFLVETLRTVRHPAVSEGAHHHQHGVDVRGRQLRKVHPVQRGNLLRRFTFGVWFS